MPTPLQILLDPVSLTVLGIYAALILLEALCPVRPLDIVGFSFKDIAASDFTHSVRPTQHGAA